MIDLQSCSCCDFTDIKYCLFQWNSRGGPSHRSPPQPIFCGVCANVPPPGLAPRIRTKWLNLIEAK